MAPPPALSLTRLMLRDFRSYPALTVPFHARIIVVSGENGVGKTNLLEAISLLGPGRGLRGARTAEFGRRVAEAPLQAPLPWAAAGRFESTPWSGFDIGTGTPDGGPPERRVFRLDGAPVRSQAELAERVATVWLTPQMDRLFQDGAGDRRRFLDRLVWALEPHHAREVAAYENAMAQRNRLLAQERREGRVDAQWLAALEDAMARHGVAAAAARRGLVGRLNATLAGGITGAFPAARLDLQCAVAAALDATPALAVEEALRAGWATARRRDAAAGATLEGPHRADLLFTHAPKGLPASLFHRRTEGAAGRRGAGPCRADRHRPRLRAAAAAGRGRRPSGCAAAGGAVRGAGGAARPGLPDRHGCRGFPAFAGHCGDVPGGPGRTRSGWRFTRASGRLNPYIARLYPVAMTRGVCRRHE